MRDFSRRFATPLCGGSFSKGASAETWNYTYDVGNHLTRVEQHATDGGTLQLRIDYSYDVYGDLLTRIQYDGSLNVVATAHFGYDAWKTDSGQSSFVGLENADVWVELDGSNNLTVRRLFGNSIDNLVARIASGGTVNWYLTDRQGSVRFIVNATGTAINTITYDGFGNATQSNAIDWYLFQGRQVEITVGIVQFRDRWLMLTIFRFTSVDPKGFGGGDTNTSRFGNNAPTNARDPSGKLPITDENGKAYWGPILKEYGVTFEKMPDGNYIVIVPAGQEVTVANKIAEMVKGGDSNRGTISNGVVMTAPGSYWIFLEGSGGVSFPVPSKKQLEDGISIVRGKPFHLPGPYNPGRSTSERIVGVLDGASEIVDGVGEIAHEIVDDSLEVVRAGGDLIRAGQWVINVEVLGKEAYLPDWRSGAAKNLPPDGQITPGYFGGCFVRSAAPVVVPTVVVKGVKVLVKIGGKLVWVEGKAARSIVEAPKTGTGRIPLTVIDEPIVGLRPISGGSGMGWGNIGSHAPVNPTTVLSGAQQWLGSGYREIAPGVYRSADGLRQFRMTIRDLTPTHGNIGPHVHFEALDAAGNVIENGSSVYRCNAGQFGGFSDRVAAADTYFGFKDEPMNVATIAIDMDIPAGITVGEYERIDDGHAFHVNWKFPEVCRCETCKREAALHMVEKDKFLTIRDLDLWGKPSFFVYQETLHRCPHCGHRQSLLPPFKRRDVKYTYRFEEHVLVGLIGGTAEDVAQRLGIAAETVERIVKNRIDDAKAKQIDPARKIERLGMDEISLRKGHKGYASILTDLTDPAQPEILAMAKGRDETAGQACLERLSAEQRAAVRFHHTDMGPAYLKACRELLLNSQSVIDRFHVAKKLGEVADALRKKTTEPTNAR